MTNGFKFFQANRPKNAPTPIAQERASIDGIEVTEQFDNDVPRVMHEHRVMPSGMPPSGWDLLPVGSLK